MKRAERRMREFFDGPLVPRLSETQIAYAKDAAAEISDDEYARLMDFWRQERRLVPVEFRSPMEKWLGYVVRRELAEVGRG
jgi:hypothetical protein